MGDEVRREPSPGEETCPSWGPPRQPRRAGRAPCGGIGDIGQHAQEPRVGQTARLGEDPPGSPAAGVGQAAALAGDAHAHLGWPGRHVQLCEQAQQIGIGPVVVDDEAAVHRERRAAGRWHLMRVGVTAEAVFCLEQGDLGSAAAGRRRSARKRPNQSRQPGGRNQHSRGPPPSRACQMLSRTIRSRDQVVKCLSMV